LYRLGKLCLKIGDLDEAERAFQICVVSHPQSSHLLYCLGATYYRKGTLEDAVESLEKWYADYLTLLKRIDAFKLLMNAVTSGDC
jgi:TolA-binding protein